MADLNPLLQSELAKILKARRISMFIKAAAILIFAAAYSIFLLQPGLIFDALDRQSGEAKGLIPMVRISGLIASGEPASLARLQKQLTSAFEYDADGVILNINSPGGTPTQSLMIHDEINRLKEKHSKRVVVVAEDTLASGAYLISMSADKIYVNPSSTVGSIGVIMRGFGFVDLASKIGIERRVYTSGESKSRFDPLEPESESDKEKASEILVDVHEQFKAVVKAGRGERIDHTNPDLFTGDFWTGRKALELGLVDGLASLQSVVESEFSGEGVIENKPQPGIGDLIEFMKDSLGVNALLSKANKPGIWLLPVGYF